jgi:hypothetical protein
MTKFKHAQKESKNHKANVAFIDEDTSESINA